MMYVAWGKLLQKSQYEISPISACEYRLHCIQTKQTESQDLYIIFITRNTFGGTKYLSHCHAIPVDVIGHVTTGLAIWGFL